MTPKEKQELQTLAEAYVAEELTPAHLGILEERLRVSEEARLYFLSYIELHAGLAWEFRGSDAALPELPDEETWPASATAAMSQASWWRRPVFRWALPLAAAVVFFAVVAALWRTTPEPVGTAPALAVVKESLHGQWADGGAVAVGTPLPPGVWELQSGLVELETVTGTILLVEAPASLELIDSLHGRLLGGNLVVRMAKGKSGFVVELPHMRVTDLGTEFGVSVALNGESRVQVYDGKVRAEARGVREGKELAHGETLRCAIDGTLAPETFSEDRFIRRFPARQPGNMPGGPLYSRSTLDTVHVARPAGPVAIDGDLSEWNREGAFRTACLPPYDGAYFVEGMMMYDADNLYVGAHVGDPEPMRNVARDNVDFAGGSVIVRVSTDRALGWPLRGTTRNARSLDFEPSPSPDSISDRVASIIMSYDARAGQPRLRLQYGFSFENSGDSFGWRGAFRPDADGRGYTLEYAIPWALLHCAEDPPQGNDVMSALWMVHWSDSEGRVSRGQLVDVTNHQDASSGVVPPYLFFQNGPSWGRAIYLPASR